MQNTELIEVLGGEKERQCSKRNPNFTLSLNDKVFDGLSSFKVETVVSFFLKLPPLSCTIPSLTLTDFILVSYYVGD